MFVELFWPKEMKELVAKYRKEGTLNENVVKNINNLVLKAIGMLGVMIIPLTMAFNNIGWYAYLFIFIFLLAIARYTATYCTNRIVLPYTKGTRDKARLESITKDPFGRDSSIFRFLLKYEYKGKIYLLKNITKEEKEHLLSQGDEIDIFVNKKNNKHNIPDFPEWHKKYNLQYKG